jgi:hypothetical protein
MKAALRQKAIELRLDHGLGYASIAKILPVAKSTLGVWLKDYPLNEDRIEELRSKNLKNNEAKIERFRNTMRKKKEDRADALYSEYSEKMRDLSPKDFFAAGLMLYIAEGSKTSDYRIALTNTDPRVIKFFVKWLNEFFGVKLDDIKVQLHLYENMNIDEEISFWVKTLGVNTDQLYKSYISKLKPSSFSYRESFRHGTCKVIIDGGQRKMQLDAAMKAFMDTFLK